ncbi:MAG: L-lysine 6-transaminase [Phycisphaerales bacterium]|nr:L-lysine 6-transaminase [Phycisphaerales bacterium]
MLTPVSEPIRINPTDVLNELRKHILVDGFELVVDLERSRGCRFHDANGDRTLLDLYGFYASMPIGFNHPYFERPEVREDLLSAAMCKVANSDVYTSQMARFVKTFDRVVGLPELPRLFFIEGGALAVENAIKAAMDWKIQKNLAAGHGEIGTEVLHFKNCFHGRTGYTMSLTNTDPKKVKYFAKFDWPRVSNPRIDYSLAEPDRTQKVLEAEKQAEAEIIAAIRERPNRICSVIIEPIQCEGGDRHFRREWFQTLRRLCDENEMLLIFDEVQTGMGVTGMNWCFQHFDVLPDLLVFGKKAQVCGVMAGERLDEIPDNVFRVSGRINSTWGGNFTDMVRSTHCLNIIEQEQLVENARAMGEQFLDQLHGLAAEAPDLIQAVRGRGLLLAFSLPDAETRDRFWRGCYEVGLLTLRCGEKSIRLRPVLDVKTDIIEEAVALMRKEIRRIKA